MSVDTVCTVVPYFEVHAGQLEAFKALVASFVERTRSESGCVHYAFAFDGRIVCCREGYEDAKAFLHHGRNAADLFAEALKISRLLRVEVHAPAAQIEQLREPLAALNPQYFVLGEGFRRGCADATGA
jgi:quinol monooxygenase YgiN